ncbi:MAG TPA: glycosyltransferase family 2 protein [Candidatus Competibacteraceae bacterium]|nr:glycosyltransferase family 2 protein [Candidatus Competibacteraceae bacterium]
MNDVLISLIIPVYNVERRWLEAAVESVRRQTYPHWQLCIADDGSDRQETLNYLQQLADERIQVLFLDANHGIAAASNSALSIAKGRFVGFLDHDDELTADALQQVIQTIEESEPDLIYSDEEYININGHHYSAHFKPDYSPDLLLSINYICHLAIYRRSLLQQIGGLHEGYDGAQDHDLLLRAVEQTRRIIHIPRILYRWRRIPGSTADRFANKHYAWEAGRSAVADALRRRGIQSQVVCGQHPGTYRVHRKIENTPTISIVIPFRDLPEILARCIESILQKTTYPHFEIIGVSNQSQEPKTLAIMADYQKRDARIRFLNYDHPFNFSAINNFAAHQAEGEHLLLLNNDTEVINSDWLEALLEHSQRPEVGAVGAKLYFPNDTIQHAGIIIGIGGSAGHSHKCIDRRDPGYFNRLTVTQNTSAVTGACLMVKKSLYLALGGLDEINLPIAFNDVDFCLRLREQGYLNVFTPYCELYHHESQSRGPETTPHRKQLFRQELHYLRQRHSTIFDKGDPYYNPHLPLNRETFGLRLRWLRPMAFAVRDEWQNHHSSIGLFKVMCRELRKLFRHVRTH